MKINRVCVMTAGAFLGALLASCTMPSAVEVQAKPALSLPLNPKSASVSGMLSDNLKGAFTDSFGFLDYVSYTDENGKPLQAFLVYYPIIEGQDIDITGQFKGFGDAFSDTGNFDQEIEIPALNDMKIGTTPIPVNLAPLFTAILNKGMSPASLNVPSGGNLNQSISMSGGSFTRAQFGPLAGTMKWTCELTGGSGSVSISNLVITIDGKPLTGLSFANVSGGTPVSADFVIPGELEITSGSVITINAQVSGSGPLTITPSFSQAILVSASGVNVEGVKLPLPNPAEIPGGGGGDNIIIAENLMPEGFYHAQIDTGSFDMAMTMPSSDFERFTVTDKTICIKQQTQSGYAGLGTPWKPDFSAANNMANRDLNQQPVILESSAENPSSITVKAQNASFTLSGGAASAGFGFVDALPSLHVGKLRTVHMNVDGFIHTEDIEVSLKDAAEFVESLKFEFSDSFGVKLKFTKSMEGIGINLKGADEDLYINDSTLKSLKSNPSFLNSQGMTLPTKKNGAVNTLIFKITMKPLETSLYTVGEKTVEVMKLTNVEPGKKIEIHGEVEFVADWTEAHMYEDAEELDNMFSGQFPKKGGDPISLDMSAMDEYLTGFQFEGIEAYLYMDGPDMFNKLNPTIDMKVTYDNTSKVLCPNEDEDGKVTFHPIPDLDPHDTGKYEGTPLKDGEHGIELDLADVINDRPKEMAFEYTITPRDENGVENFVIYPEMLESDSDEPVKKLSAMLFIVLPLKLRAGDGGGSIPLPEMFSEGSDIFGRSGSGDSIADMIKSAALNIEMSGALASAGQAGGMLTITNQANPSQEPLVELPLDKKNLNVNLGPPKLAIINAAVPYTPEIKLAFLPGSVLELPRGFGLLKIGFSADLNYRIDL